MTSNGQSISLYLMGGKQEGIWQASMLNWTGRAYKIPHHKLKECTELEYINTPGVYFLFGKDGNTGKTFFYVGEAEDTLKRLTQPHLFETKGQYWTEAIVFVTTDGSLEKGRVKYLENRFYTIAKKADRYILQNGNTPTSSKVSKPIRDFLEEFIKHVELLTPVLGFTPFHASQFKTKKNDPDILYLGKNKDRQAKGKLDADGFWVLKGSYIYPGLADHVALGVKKAREKYAEGIDEKRILQKDVCLSSPSGAATFVRGRNTNGQTEWKNKDGIPLKNLMLTDGQGYIAPKQLNKTSIAAPIYLHLKSKDVEATAWIEGNEFIVQKGSGFRLSETSYCQPNIKKKRKQFVDNGNVKDGVFIKDTSFSSPSTASDCILGASTNGYKYWRHEDGTLLKHEEFKKK